MTRRKLKAEALAALGQYEAAGEHWRVAIENVGRTQERGLLWRLHVGLGKLHRELGDPAAAENQFSLARLQIDALTSRIPDENLRRTFRRNASQIVGE